MTQVQGTMNGIGERCGNVDLTAVIANLELKYRRQCCLRQLDTSRGCRDESGNCSVMTVRSDSLLLGLLLSHKGGVHVSAVLRNPETYEHVSPDSIGNARKVLISELAGAPTSG